MDAIAPIPSSSAPPSAFGELKSEDFVKLIFTELSRQDPLEPNDSNALMEQLANIRSIQSDVDMEQKLASLIGQSEFAAASQMIGRVVSGLDESGARVLDIVASVSRTADGPVLNLASGARVSLADADEILDLPEAGS